ncbi:hypothetical protein RB195_018694 [Necator americanus]|uniref:Uncharacterized protein n=1 Tax=Necator americanus TaxID=51031 RepID=A0ABR1CAW7_NECAM
MHVLTAESSAEYGSNTSSTSIPKTENILDDEGKEQERKRKEARAKKRTARVHSEHSTEEQTMRPSEECANIAMFLDSF